MSDNGWAGGCSGCIKAWLLDPATVELLAKVTHDECIEDWNRRPPGSMVTQHHG